LEALEKEQFKVKVPEDIRVKAKRALDRMLNVA
jgi:quinolinate synthase